MEKITALKNLAEQSETPQYTYPFRSQRNSKSIPKQYEKNGEPSKTIPDQSMSIKEILRRYASGLPLEGSRVPIYNGDEAFPDTRKMDLSEIEELKRQNQKDIRQMQRDLEEQSRPKPKPTKTEEQTEKPSPNSAPPSGGASGEAKA